MADIQIFGTTKVIAKMNEIIHLLITDYTLQNVALGSAVLGLVSGALGSFAFLRKESLMGDVVAHSALLGITVTFLISFLITGVGLRNEPLLLLGAVISGIIAMVFVSKITSDSRIKNDSAMGIILAIFFGSGMFLLTMIQRSSIDNKSGLSGFIFGSAATISHENVILMSILGIFALGMMIVFWKEFKIHTFDPEFAHTIGFNNKKTDFLIISMIVIAIVIGLQAVGVILMVAMIVAPASAARQWTDNLTIMVFLSSVIGMFSGIIGALASSLESNLPTGPTIVLTATSFFIISVLFSHKRGIIFNLIRNLRNKQKIQLSLVLEDMYYLGLNHKNDNNGHSSKVIKSMNYDNFNITKSLRILSEQGFVKELTNDSWILTKKGAEKVAKTRNSYGDNDD